MVNTNTGLRRGLNGNLFNSLELDAEVDELVWYSIKFFMKHWCAPNAAGQTNTKLYSVSQLFRIKSDYTKSPSSVPDFSINWLCNWTPLSWFHLLPDYLIRRGASLEQGDQPMGTGLLVMEIRTNIESLKNTVYVAKTIWKSLFYGSNLHPCSTYKTHKIFP